MQEFDSKLLVQRISEGMLPAHELLGIELVDIQDEFVSFRLPFREEIIGNIVHKRVHGGIIAAVMDAVGGAVAILNFKSFEDQCSTINMQVNYLRPTNQEELIFEGKNIKNGSRVVFTEMIAYHPSEPDIIIATSTAAYSFKAK